MNSAVSPSDILFKLKLSKNDLFVIIFFLGSPGMALEARTILKQFLYDTTYTHVYLAMILD